MLDPDCTKGVLMSMSARLRSRSLLRVAVPAVALALLMSACGSDVDSAPVATSPVVAAPTMSTTTESAMTSESADATSTESSATESGTTESMTTESSTTGSTESTTESSTADSTSESSSTESTKESTTAKPSAPTKAQPITGPGTVLKVGEAAVVEYQTGKKGEKYYQHGTMSAAITKIVKADPKVFDKLDNKAEFKDFVPYYVFSESKILSYEGAADGNPPTQIVIYGLLPDGTEAGKAIGLGSLEGCEDSYFDEPKVGATATKCTVTLAKKGGDPVVGAVYEGDTDLYADSADNPYTKKPVIWAP